MITYERIRKLFNYRDGNLIWKFRKNNCIKIDTIAGYKNKFGYTQVRVDYKLYQLHRLIWLYHYGYMPENEIDHIDKNPNNNRIENLREVSSQCNLRNIGNFKHNTSGVKGVGWDKSRKKWITYIKVNQKNKSLGRYKDFDNAVLVRLAAEQCLDWSNCDSCSPAYQYAIKHGLIRG